ncbi:MAG: hypothetical protein U1E35_03930 [Rhodospirillales bacterium]
MRLQTRRRWQALDPQVLADPQKAAATAETIAKRMDALEKPANRGWHGALLGKAAVALPLRTLRGVGERHVIDAAIIDSSEARRLNARAAPLQQLYREPGLLRVKDKEHPVSGPVALVDAVSMLGRKGVAMQRYKGLGEMNPDQLWQTTLDPNARTLLQVRVSHADDAEEVFSTLMGDTVETRRDFIETNALKVANLDA